MPNNQSALSTLIGEVLADPDLAHSDVFASDAAGRAAGPDRGRSHREDRCGPSRTQPRAHDPPKRDPPKTLATPAGEIELAIPKLREGSFFPALLNPRRRVDKALYAV